MFATKSTFDQNGKIPDFFSEKSHQIIFLSIEEKME
jgi:hypothetical protein